MPLDPPVPGDEEADWTRELIAHLEQKFECEIWAHDANRVRAHATDDDVEDYLCAICYHSDTPVRPWAATVISHDPPPAPPVTPAPVLDAEWVAQWESHQREMRLGGARARAEALEKRLEKSLAERKRLEDLVTSSDLRHCSAETTARQLRMRDEGRGRELQQLREQLKAGEERLECREASLKYHEAELRDLQ
jgi:hypothetical protein